MAFTTRQTQHGNLIYNMVNLIRLYGCSFTNDTARNMGTSRTSNHPEFTVITDVSKSHGIQMGENL